MVEQKTQPGTGSVDDFVAALVDDQKRADSVAFTCTAAPNVKPITEKGACIGFVASDANGKQVQRVDKGYQISGSIHATPV